VIFRDGVLEGVVIAVAGAGEPGEAAARACRELGATIVTLTGADEDALAAEVAALDQIDMVVGDATRPFDGTHEPLEALRASVDGTWDAVRAVANGAFIPGGRGGRVLMIAPRASAGPFAQAARAALENTARTLSVEWARHGISVTALAPGDPAEVAVLAVFLASPAGGYYSGCTFELAGAR
jgi:NAD(P)-dependent dehydrogenase (short-subunit alcohol dehydrogenase family)